MKVVDSILDLAGNTPMVRLNRMGRHVKPDIYVKVEFFNPTGSIKDRIARFMLDRAEEEGLLRPGSTIVEPTTGNTGIALSAAAAYKGYRMMAVMPEFVSEERRGVMEAYGAQVVLTPKSEGIEGVVRKAYELAESDSNVFLPDQFRNYNNCRAHYESTGREIWEQLDGNIDVFVAAAGTGGTISGTGSYLREKREDVRIVVVEPACSAVLSGGEPGHHRIQGIGEGFIPEVLDTGIYDEIICVTDEEAEETCRRLAREESIFGGTSSGANVFAALKVAEGMDGGNVVTIIPDCGMKYLTTGMYRAECTTGD